MKWHWQTVPAVKEVYYLPWKFCFNKLSPFKTGNMLFHQFFKGKVQISYWNMNQNNNIKLYNRRLCLKINLDSNNTRVYIFSIGFDVKVNWDYLPLLKHIFKKEMVKKFFNGVYIHEILFNYCHPVIRYLYEIWQRWP